MAQVKSVVPDHVAELGTKWDMQERFLAIAC